MEIIFIRHPSTDGNEQKKYLGNTDAVLSRKGEKQARIIARFLRKKKISAVYSSALKRSFWLASLIAREHSLKVKQEKGLCEFDFGQWEGMTFDQIKKKYPRIAQKYLLDPLNVRIPGGESFSRFKNRVIMVIKKILRKEKGTVVIVGHGGVNRIIFCFLMKIPFLRFWHIKQDVGAINAIEMNKGFNVISFLNLKLWED